MRTIKFRGKSKATGEWLYGFYQEHEDGRVAITPALNGELQEASDYEVIPETVGQYVGLKDKNGKEIYEGDVLAGDETIKLLVQYSDPKERYHGTVIDNIYDNLELLKQKG